MTNHRTPGNPGDEFDDDFDDFESDLDEDADELDAEFDALTSRLSAPTGDVYDDESDDEQEDDSGLADLKALFGDDGFRVIYPNGESRYSWSEVSEIKELENYIVLYLGKVRAYLIPKKYIIRRDFNLDKIRSNKWKQLRLKLVVK